jgi:hypothetical protein
VNAVENPLHACSGCAGDYEDPDQTAWEEEEEEKEAQEKDEQEKEGEEEQQ